MSRLVFHQRWCLKHSGCPCSYKDNLNLIAKVLDFDQLGGPGWTRTIDLGLIRGLVKNQPNSGCFRYKTPGALPPFFE